MNVQLVSPAALIATLAATDRDDGRSGTPLWRRLTARLAEEVRYRRALRELRRFDDRDLDDLNLGRGDLPAMARSHARAMAAL